ncbi:TetR/AcrR family transcriptional regulator [Irregularibacter muris]|uniref:TetR/AcrR family transcriptional regulator n=1 Tax=Irregularibacter muris TaxID=1796619 RepID=A0AAE3L029_9FIRM|nr:TetR/AcrR family transcriptional regulator [Irregularibacter muris]MCR1899611.1 TetR/AcrR family transcriptional regulator [Irregularibacter muris]
MGNKESQKRISREERRKQILNAAMVVFVEKGYSGSTTAEIAKAANISEVTLFRYFSSKQEIFLEGIKPILLSTLEESIDVSKDLNSREKLEYILYERIHLISKNYKIIKLILMEAPLLSQLGNENFMEEILGMLKRLIDQMGVSKEKEEFILRLLMGSILSFLFMPDRKEESIKNYVEKISTMILNQFNQ